jgi:hypothetical protein
MDNFRRIALPKGLDWDTVQAGVQIVENWELRADGLATELVIRLYELFSARLAELDEGSK